MKIIVNLNDKSITNNKSYLQYKNNDEFIEAFCFLFKDNTNKYTLFCKNIKCFYSLDLSIRNILERMKYIYNFDYEII